MYTLNELSQSEHFFQPIFLLSFDFSFVHSLPLFQRSAAVFNAIKTVETINNHIRIHIVANYLQLTASKRKNCVNKRMEVKNRQNPFEVLPRSCGAFTQPPRLDNVTPRLDNVKQKTMLNRGKPH